MLPGIVLNPPLNGNLNFRTLPAGIALCQGGCMFPWQIVSAASTVAIVPLAVLIPIFQGRVIGRLS